MLARKFSFDIPKLKIGPSGRSYREPSLPPFDSPLITPKSVRPPLPSDVDAELRAACTYVVENYKPSHENWLDVNSKHDLDFSTVNAPTDTTSLSTVDTSAARFGKSESDTVSTSYRYKAGTAVTTLPEEDERARSRARKNARLRAEELMGSAQAVEQTGHACATDVPVLPQHPISSAFHSAAGPPLAQTFSRSTGTSNSTLHTDGAEAPWTSSTGVTSAAITPSRTSKRTSSQAMQSNYHSTAIPNMDSPNVDAMRSESSTDATSISNNGTSAVAHPVSAHAMMQGPQTSVKVPSRKPVPSSRNAKQVSHTPSNHPIEEPRSSSVQSRADSLHPRMTHPEESGPRARSEAVPDAGTENVSGTATRATSQTRSRAKTVADGLGSLFRRKSFANLLRNAEDRTRPASRASKLTQGVSEYVKPTTGHADADADTKTRIHRFRSFGSSHSNLSSQPRDGTGQIRRAIHTSHTSTGALYDFSRPRTSSSGSRGTHAQSERGLSLPSDSVDLNRELPPLPSLDQWTEHQRQTDQHLPIKPKPDVRNAAHPQDTPPSSALDTQGSDALPALEHSRSQMFKSNFSRPLDLRRHKSVQMLRTGQKHQVNGESKRSMDAGHDQLLAARNRSISELGTQSSSALHHKERSRWRWWQSKEPRLHP